MSDDQDFQENAPDTPEPPPPQPAAERPYYKTVFVGVKMLETGEYKTFRRQIGTKKVKKPKGIFSKEIIEVDQPIYETVREWQSSGQKSISEIDTDDFSARIEDACNQLHAEGYSVLSMLPVIRGTSESFVQPGALTKGTGITSISYAFGHGITDGVIITAKKN